MDHIEIPVGAFLEHWQNQCQIHATVAPVLTSPTRLYHAKQMRHPTTEKDQYNQAMVVLKNLADTISSLAAPVQLMVIDASSAKDAITPSSTIDQDPVIDSSSAEDVITTSSEAVLSLIHGQTSIYQQLQKQEVVPKTTLDTSPPFIKNLNDLGFSKI